MVAAVVLGRAQETARADALVAAKVVAAVAAVRTTTGNARSASQGWMADRFHFQTTINRCHEFNLSGKKASHYPDCHHGTMQSKLCLLL